VTALRAVVRNDTKHTWFGLAHRYCADEVLNPAILGPDVVSGEVAYVQFHQSAFYQDGAMRKPVVHSILKGYEDLNRLLVPWKSWFFLFVSSHNKEVVACPGLPARPTHLEVRACRGRYTMSPNG
jgi:hypothetical protein